MTPFPLRQVHLDFHTSPHILDVASEFDPEAFADTFTRASVNSVTLFAKCHHGMCYYPTQTGTPHPALQGRDLLGEQIEALHRVGIRTPIYTTVVWEEDAAQKHPEWRQLTREGFFAGTASSSDTVKRRPGIWKFMSFLHPDYQEYIEAHIRELCSRYEVDGIFFDILFHAAHADWNEPARALRRKHGLENDDAATHEQFEALAQQQFTRRFSKLIKSLAPAATIFYNAHNDLRLTSVSGPRVRLPAQTHLEIESLPSGYWGYYHFPRIARALRQWGKPWLGMTGRFQKMWGDFGGLKPLPALEFECFRSQALGGGNSIGDQLPPRGTLDPDAYKHIGSVYLQCKEAELFYRDTRPCPQLGIFTPANAGSDNTLAGQSEEGAVLLCEEAHYDAQLLDENTPLRSLRTLILPDNVLITQKVKERLLAFHRGGGQIILSYRSGFDAKGNWALNFLPLRFQGHEETSPTYWRSDIRSPVTWEGDRVCYSAGLKVQGEKETQVWVRRVMPYFMRTDIHYSSHSSIPPIAEPSRFPAILAGKGFVYFADPVFREFRKSGNPAVREIWRETIRLLLGPPLCGEGLPSTISVYPLRRKQDLLLTLLHYVPVRKAMDIDVIDERGTFAGENLRFNRPVRCVLHYPSNQPLEQNGDGTFRLPATKGRLLLRVPGFF